MTQDIVDVVVLWAEVTRTRGAVAAAETAHAAAMLAVEASAWEAITVRDGATLRIKDAEDRAALVKREVLERISRAEAESPTTLTSTRDDAEGLAQRIALE
jgi:hypothetical protein